MKASAEEERAQKDKLEEELKKQREEIDVLLEEKAIFERSREALEEELMKLKASLQEERAEKEKLAEDSENTKQVTLSFYIQYYSI